MKEKSCSSEWFWYDSFMRVIAGEKKGHPLYAPKSFFTRPTADRVREALFNILGPIPEEARVLDLFAGSGALGLEALSRGAKEAVFVEESREACQVIQKNAHGLGFQPQVKLMQEPVLNALRHLPGKFHLVFIDPPYQSNLAQQTLAFLEQAANRLLFPEAMIVVEYFSKRSSGQVALQSAYGHLLLYDIRTYGQTGISFYEYRPSQASSNPESSHLPRHL